MDLGVKSVSYHNNEPFLLEQFYLD